MAVGVLVVSLVVAALDEYVYTTVLGIMRALVVVVRFGILGYDVPSVEETGKLANAKIGLVHV
jgi:hypothetical protein